jgi:predicted NBD/HSP70 family sugar kinase
VSTTDLVTTAQLGAMNTRRLIDAILRTGAISRAQLSRDTGLSKPTVSLALARLAAKGLVREVGRTSGGRGATALLYDLEPRAGYALAMDVGRNWIRAVLTDLSGQQVGELSRRTGGRGAAALADQLIEVATGTIAQAGVAKNRLVAATMGTPGVVLPEGDHVTLAPSLPGLQKPGVMEQLRDALGVEVRLENDVNLAAMAELALGRGRTERDFVYLSIGTGVGMALVLNGELRRGISGSAGEIAYLPLPSTLAQEDDGSAARKRGAFESTVCADAFVQAARQAGMTVRNAQQVVEAARAGDARALEVITTKAEALALGVATIAALIDPGLIVLGGGLGLGAAELLADPLDRALQRISPLRPRVVASELGDHAVLDGAVASAFVAAQDAVFGPVTGHAGVMNITDRAYLAGARMTGAVSHEMQEDK